MTPTQYQKAKAKLGRGHTLLGRALGYSKRSSERYATGTSEIPKSVAKLLKLAASGRITLEEIAEL